MIIKFIIDFTLGNIQKLLDMLPDVSPISIPDSVKNALSEIVGFGSYLMPFSLYKPLFVFLLSLVAFRLVYGVILFFKK